jgi:hypothetical protein
MRASPSLQVINEWYFMQWQNLSMYAGNRYDLAGIVHPSGVLLQYLHMLYEYLSASGLAVN